MLRELAPWMKVMDALSEISFAREGLTDMPIPRLHHGAGLREEGYPAWAYFCCGPEGRYAQRLLDTPLVKTRMFGWLLYRPRARGFLHWGYNYWYRSQTQELIDPSGQRRRRWPELVLRRHLPGLPRPRRADRFPALGSLRRRAAGLRPAAIRGPRPGRPAAGGDQGLRRIPAERAVAIGGAGEGVGEVGSEIGRQDLASDDGGGPVDHGTVREGPAVMAFRDRLMNPGSRVTVAKTGEIGNLFC